MFESACNNRLDMLKSIQECSIMFKNVVICNKKFSAYGLKLLIIQLICHGVLKVLNQHLLVQEVLHHHQHLLHLLIHQKEEILSGNYINN